MTPRLPALLAAGLVLVSSGCASSPPAAPPEDPAAAAPPVTAVAFDIDRMTPPKALYAPQPEYTSTARRARWKGAIASEVLIDEEGRVRAIRLLDRAPHGLDASMRRTLETWRFEPALLEGQPVAVWYRLHTRFDVW